MSEDTRRVLDLLAAGKITADEADRLIAAIGPASTGSAGPGAAAAAKGATSVDTAPPKFLRIAVTKTKSWSSDEGAPARRSWMSPGHKAGGSHEVSIRVPVALLRNGMRFGAMIPGIAGAGLKAHLRERGIDIDLSKLDADTIDQLVNEFGEMNIDIASDRGGKAQVRITTE